MAFHRHRPPHPLRPELDAQSVDQLGDLDFAAWLLDQAFLGGGQILGPVGDEREGVESETRIESCGFVGEQPLQMLRLAAGDRRRHAPGRHASVDAEAVKRQTPGTEPPLFQLDDELRNQPVERLR